MNPQWLTPEGKTTVEKIVPEKNLRDAYTRVAHEVEKILNIPYISEDVFEMLWSGYMGLATPVLTNFGSDKGLPVSCYSVHVGDSVDSIYSHKHELAMMSKEGGGVGVYLGDIRPKGTKISDGGTSNGIVPWAKEYDLTASVVSQGGTRRGNCALYLPIDHPDLLELYNSKDHSKGDPRLYVDNNIAVTVTDDFMNKMIAGDKEKQATFSETLRNTMMIGSPYMIFIDNVNKYTTPSYRKHGLKVKTSNLCFTGDVKVQLSDGTVETLENLYERDRPFWVLNAKFLKGQQKWETQVGEAIAVKTSDEPVETMMVRLENGEEFRCTPDHKLYLPNGKSVRAYDCLGEYLQTQQGKVQVKAIGDFKYEHTYCLQVGHNSNFYIVVGDSSPLVANCSEITLYTDPDHSFVCVLSSMNLSKWFEWKDYTSPNYNLSAPELAIFILESVCESFIQKASKFETQAFDRAIRSAKKGRPLGLGTMGLHQLYQMQGLPFKSSEARKLNVEIHKFINDEAWEASRKLAEMYGEPEWCEGLGTRHTHVTAIAPTRTNSVVCNAGSQGIEPIFSNYFSVKQGQYQSYRKNPLLEQLLESLGRNTYQVWESILENGGSVRHLGFLSPYQKDVFATAREIDQFEIISQAIMRQDYVSQAQSVNLFVDPNCSPEYLFRLYLSAWRNGLKSIYYLRCASPTKFRIQKSQARMITKEGCPWCVKAKEFLSSLNIEYEEIVVENLDKYQYKTVPQIWIDNVYIGGYDRLIQNYKSPGVDGVKKTISECSACEG